MPLIRAFGAAQGEPRGQCLEQIGQTGGSAVAEKRVDFAYNAASEFSTITRYKDTDGLTTDLVAASAYTRDGMGRLTGLHHTRQAGATITNYTWQFDVGSRVTQYSSSVDGTSNYTYDDTDQLIASDHSFQPDEADNFDLNGNRTNTGFTTGADNRLTSDGTFNYTYDNEGNRLTRTRISGAPADDYLTEYSWDHRNRLTGVTFKNNAGAVTKSLAFQYDVFDRRIEVTFDPDGAGSGAATITRLVYDPSAKTDPATGTPLFDIVLAFNEVNDLTHRYLHGPGIDQILADEQFAGGGQMMMSGGDSTLDSESSTLDSASALDTGPSTLDSASALDTEPSTSDSSDPLMAAAMQQIAAMTSLYYGYPAPQPSPSPEPSPSPIPPDDGGGSSAMSLPSAPGNVLWSAGDNQGTVRDVVQFDPGTSTTIVVNHIKYDSFGKPTSETNPTVEFVYGWWGQEFSEGSQLVVGSERAYDVLAHVWISQDPLPMGVPGTNPYVYVHNGPTNATDPSGLDLVTALKTAARAAKGTALEETTAWAASFADTFDPTSQSIRIVEGVYDQVRAGKAHHIVSSAYVGPIVDPAVNGVDDLKANVDRGESWDNAFVNSGLKNVPIVRWVWQYEEYSEGKEIGGKSDGRTLTPDQGRDRVTSSVGNDAALVLNQATAAGVVREF